MALPATSRFRNEFETKPQKGNCMCLPCFGKKSQPQDTEIVKATPLTPELVEKTRKHKEADEKVKKVFEEKK